MNVGKWIQQVREDRFIRPADIERTSHWIAGAKGCPEYYIPLDRLADIENGSVPSLYHIYSLAICMKISCKQLLRLFGIDFEKTSQFADRPSLAVVDPLPLEDYEEAADPRLDFDPQISLRETYLLGSNPEHWGNVPAQIQKRLQPTRFRYAVIGFKDDTMADILPPGSLVEVDAGQRQEGEPLQSRELPRSPWKSLWGRPIYLVQHVDGYSCCWCQQDDDELTLVPHPLSHQKAMHFKMPHEALIIGRVVNAWTPAQLDTMLPQSMQSYALSMATSPTPKYGPQSTQSTFTEMFEPRRNGRSIA
jgi:hypothetical protein